MVVLAAIEQTGIGLERWLRQVEQPIEEGPRLPIRPLPESTSGAEAKRPSRTRPQNRLFGPDVLRQLSEPDSRD